MSWNQPSTNQPSYTSPQLADVRDERVSAFLSKVYGWMFLGLLITALTALAVASTPLLIETLILNRLLFWGLLFAQLGLVFYLWRHELTRWGPRLRPASSPYTPRW
mgnify:CR=1 FL=1